MQKKIDTPWNPFARELVAILMAHHIFLKELHQHISVLPDKVRRIALSLTSPSTFPLLIYPEIDQLVQVCGLTGAEFQRLQAALITTAIEKLLINRLRPEIALQIANTVFPLIVQALAGQLDGLHLAGFTERGDPLPAGDAKDDPAFVSTWRTIERGDLLLAKDDEDDLAFISAWRAIDNGTLAFNLSYQVDRQVERLERVRQARLAFQQALTMLDKVDAQTRGTQLWQNWYSEAERDLLYCQKRLQDLGDA